MAAVFLVEHYHPLSDEAPDSKLIGIYTTREKAERAVRDLAEQPGFRDLPDVIADPAERGSLGIWRIELDETAWSRGYETV